MVHQSDSQSVVFHAAGRDGLLDVAIKRDDGAGLLVSFQRNASRNPGACGASGLKKRFPSKCFGKETLVSVRESPVLFPHGRGGLANFLEVFLYEGLL